MDLPRTTTNLDSSVSVPFCIALFAFSLPSSKAIITSHSHHVLKVAV